MTQASRARDENGRFKKSDFGYLPNERTRTRNWLIAIAVLAALMTVCARCFLLGAPIGQLFPNQPTAYPLIRH